jgi:pimeloyl-ACP methyl ester carboxylesterase
MVKSMSRFGSGRGKWWTLAAVAGAATAAWTAYKAREAGHDNPPLGRFITVDGVRLHYIERGIGDPIVLLHGNVVRLHDFLTSGLIDQLAEHYRVIAFDRPGFGHSERPRDRLWTAATQAELLHNAFVALGIERPIVLGHSWGTLPALELALDKRAGVRRLVLVSGYYFPTARLDVPVFATPAIPIIGDVMRYTVSALFARLTLNRIVKTMFSPQPVPSDFVPSMAREMMVRPSQIRANAEDAASMMTAAEWLSKRYGELTIAVAVMAGAADRVVDPDAHARRLHVELKDSELHILPGIGHMLHYFAPEHIVSAVTRERAVTADTNPGGGEQIVRAPA